jgi:ribosome-associated toxin RatA of RatAB toxin-antitoxin module
MTDDHRHGVQPLPGFKAALTVVLTALTVSLSPVADAAANALKVTQEQWSRLENGEVLVAANQVQGPTKGTVAATVLINAPAERIWQVMVDCADIPSFVPGVEDCQVLDSGENWEIIRHDVKWVWFFPRLSYVFRAQYQPIRKIDFTRIDGDLRDMQGSWRLIPVGDGGRTLVRYRVYLDPGFWVPQWLVRNSLKKDLPQVLTALRTKVGSFTDQQQ